MFYSNRRIATFTQPVEDCENRLLVTSVDDPNRLLINQEITECIKLLDLLVEIKVKIENRSTGDFIISIKFFSS